MKRPSFLPSLDTLEQQAMDRSAQGEQPGSQFGHPTAKYIFIVGLVVTVVAHIVGGVLFAILEL